MEELKSLVNEYSWLLVTGIALLLFNNTIQELVDGIMIFLGNDYNEDDVVEVDGKPVTVTSIGDVEHDQKNDGSNAKQYAWFWAM